MKSGGAQGAHPGSGLCGDGWGTRQQSHSQLGFPSGAAAPAPGPCPGLLSPCPCGLHHAGIRGHTGAPRAEASLLSSGAGSSVVSSLTRIPGALAVGCSGSRVRRASPRSCGRSCPAPWRKEPMPPWCSAAPPHHRQGSAVAGSSSGCPSSRVPSPQVRCSSGVPSAPCELRMTLSWACGFPQDGAAGPGMARRWVAVSWVGVLWRPPREPLLVTGPCHPHTTSAGHGPPSHSPPGPWPVFSRESRSPPAACPHPAASVSGPAVGRWGCPSRLAVPGDRAGHRDLSACAAVVRLDPNFIQRRQFVGGGGGCVLRAGAGACEGCGGQPGVALPSLLPPDTCSPGRSVPLH